VTLVYFKRKSPYTILHPAESRWWHGAVLPELLLISYPRLSHELNCPSNIKLNHPPLPNSTTWTKITHCLCAFSETCCYFTVLHPFLLTTSVSSLKEFPRIHPHRRSPSQHQRIPWKDAGHFWRRYLWRPSTWNLPPDESVKGEKFYTCCQAAKWGGKKGLYLYIIFLKIYSENCV